MFYNCRWGELEASTMSRGKQKSKQKGRAKAVTVLGVAGALSLAGSASRAAVGPPGDPLTANVTLYEEEISDVSLSTFYVFDHENAGARRPGGLQLARRTRSRASQGGGGGAVDDCAGGGPTCCAASGSCGGACA